MITKNPCLRASFRMLFASIAASAFLVLGTTRADAAEALSIFENSGRTIQRDAFSSGQNIFGRIKGIAKANRSFCYKMEWVRPDGTIAATVFLAPVNSATRDVPPFALPAAGPSGKWTLRAFRATSSGSCGGTNYGATPILSTQFDVARTVIVGADSPCAKAGSADAPGGDNFVDQTSAQAGNIQGNGLGVELDVRSRSSANKRAFMRFNLAGLPGSVTVNDARLRLFMFTAPKSSRTHNLYALSASWFEGAITWNNQAAASSNLLASAATGNANNTLVYWSGAQLKTNVQNLVANPATNFGWRIGDANESQGGNDDNLARFRSTEADADTGSCPIKKIPNKTLWPVLLLDYTDTCTTAPTVNGPICEGAINVSGTSSETNGTIIELFVNDVSAGSTSVSGGTWNKSVSALSGGDRLSAKATATGKCTSGASFQVTVESPSIAPTGANASLNNLCPGDTTTLNVTGGQLGAGANWVWYSGNPTNGLVEDTGDTIDVSPTTTTTYYVRAENGCNATASASVTVTVKGTTLVPPPTQTIVLADNCSATLPDCTSLATVSNACATNVTVTQSPPPGTLLTGAGPLTVSLIADDGSSNTATGSFTVNRINLPPRLFSPARNGSTFQVSVITLTGRIHVLEFTDALTSPTWTSLLPGIVGDGTVKTLTDDTASGPQRFYRVRVECP
jgi:hypothetical protein